MTELKRSSGLLLHPTSLPGPYGIGDIGEAAYRWVDFLVRAKQRIWQILPLGPTGYGDSPYQTSSVFAGNPLLIDVARLAREEFITNEALINAPSFSEGRVNFETVINWKLPLLLEAANNFLQKAGGEEKNAYQDFCNRNNGRWLHGFAFFMALKNHFGGGAWSDWPAELKLRNYEALQSHENQLKHEIELYKVLQYLFYKQWFDLKHYANENGIQIMGDIPIYTSYDSAEVWANQDYFHLDTDGNPEVVAGVPPDLFSKTGQLWGNPLYRWEVLAKDGFRWWIERVEMNLQCVDLVRLDHFRGFEGYYAVPFGDPTAEHGEWNTGPGSAFFDKLIERLGDIPFIAENLGFITPEVEALREKYNYPGMKILQFAFDSGPENDFLLHHHDKNCVVYTGSHDNDTTSGWFQKASEDEKDYLIKYLGRQPEDIAWELIRLAFASPAVLAIIPMQDVLGLDSSARMNMPGNPSGNWSWRLLPDQISEHHAKRLAEFSEIYGRTG